MLYIANKDQVLFNFDLHKNSIVSRSDVMYRPSLYAYTRGMHTKKCTYLQ